MQLWKTHARRIAALVCTLAMTACLLPSAAFATGTEPAAQPGAAQGETADNAADTAKDTPQNKPEDNAGDKTEATAADSAGDKTASTAADSTGDKTASTAADSTGDKTANTTTDKTGDTNEDTTGTQGGPDGAPVATALNSLAAAPMARQGTGGMDTDEVFFYILKPSLATGLTENVNDYYFLVRGGKVSQKGIAEYSGDEHDGQGITNYNNEATIKAYVEDWPTDKEPGEGWVTGTSTCVGENSTWTINQEGEVTEFSLVLGDKTYTSERYEIRWSKFSHAQTSPDVPDHRHTYHMDGILYEKTLVEDAVNKIQPKKVGLMFPLTDEGKQGGGPATFTFTLSRLPGEGEEATDENDFTPVKMTATVNALGEEAAITPTDEKGAKQKLLPGNYKIEEVLEGKDADIWAVPDTITFTVSTDGTITQTSDAVIQNNLAQYGLYYGKNLGTDISADASNMPDNQTSAIYYNSRVTVSDTVPMREGYWFKGWNTQQDGTGVAYKGGDQIPIQGNVTLYAQWEPMYKFTLQPANMTIYVGGSGTPYGGIVDGAGNPGKGDNSLPEPGFYFTLPDKVNEELNKALGEDDPKAAVDLSKYVTVTATADDGSTRNWTLEPYGSKGEDGSSTAKLGEDDQERFVYRIVPDAGQDLIRVQIKNGDTVVTSDSFEPSKALYAEYKVSLYTGTLEPEDIVMTITVPRDDSAPLVFRCQYNATGSTPGTLTVRHASEDVPTTPAAVGEDALAEKIEGDPDSFHVQIDDQQNVYLNETDHDTQDGGITVAHDDVSLLADTLVGGDNNAYLSALYEKAQTKAGFARANVDSAYLDLVDASNGNAWLTAEGKVKVFWPYRNGMNQNSTLKLYHFEGLDRNMTTEDLLDQIAQTEATPVPFTQDEHGITFEMDSFSPFVLVSDTTPAPQPSTGGSSQSNTVTVTATAPTPMPAPTAKPAAAAAVIPQTGDDMPVGLLAGLAVVAAGGLAALLVLRKRRGDR